LFRTMRTALQARDYARSERGDLQVTLLSDQTALVRTGKFRPDALDGIELTPDVVLSSVADLPAWLESQ